MITTIEILTPIAKAVVEHHNQCIKHNHVQYWDAQQFDNTQPYADLITLDTYNLIVGHVPLAWAEQIASNHNAEMEMLYDELANKELQSISLDSAARPNGIEPADTNVADCL